MRHEVQEITLPSGVKGLLIDVPGSSVLDMSIVFRGGFQYAPPHKYETPHLIEHHVFNATKTYGENGRIMTEFGRNGAHNNAFTSTRYIGYTVECAADESSRILGLLQELIARPVFPEADYLTERENVRSELARSAGDYRSVVSILNMAQAYPALMTPFKPRIDQLDTITHADVVSHYHQTHQSANANFVIAGSVASVRQSLEQDVDAIFQELPTGERRSLADGIGQSVPVPAWQAADTDAVYYDLAWYAKGGDQAELAAARLLRTLLASGFESRMYGQARRLGLTYHLSASLNQSSLSSEFNIGAFVNPNKADELFALIGREAARIAATPPTPAELEAARHKVIGLITVGTQTPSTIGSWYSGDYFFDGSIVSYDSFFEDLRAVTPEAVQAVAAKMFNSGRHSAAFVGPVDEAKAAGWTGALGSVWQ